MTAIAQTSAPARWQPASVDFAVVAAAALPLALVSPVLASIVALGVFGLGHTVFELRWVLARFRPMFTTGLTAALAAPATFIAVNRLLGGPRQLEIAAGFALVGIGLAHARRTHRVSTAAATAIVPLLAAALTLSLSQPGMYGIVLAHLHNVVTAVLLWEWTRDTRFRRGLVAAYAVVPALILAGAADAFLPDHVAQSGAAGMLAKSMTPAGWLGTTAGVRLVAVFAFLQLVHYGVWCWLLPRRDRATTPTPAPAASTMAVVVLATVLLALVFATDYASGRAVYTSVATYHAYLEFPVVLVLLGGSHAQPVR